MCTDETINSYNILDLLSLLTEKSIIIYDDSKDRYRILESIKHYGQEKLTEENEILLKHLNYFSDLTEKAKPELLGENAKIWLDILEADHKNIQSAIEWGVRNANSEKSANVAASLGKFWEVRGYFSTGIKFLDIVLERTNELSNFAKSNAISWKGVYLLNQGEYEKAQRCFDESLLLRRELGDDRGIAVSLNGLGNVAFYRGDYEQTQSYDEEILMLFRELGDKNGIAGTLNNLGHVAYLRGEYIQSQKYFTECLVIRRELGDKRGIANPLHGLGNVAFYLGEYKQSQNFYEESLELRRELGDKKGIAVSLNGLGNAMFPCGEYEQAQKYFEESLVLRRELGDKDGIAELLNNMGNVSFSKGDYKQSQNFYEESLELRRELGDKDGIAESLISLSGIFLVNKNFQTGVKLLSAAETALKSRGVILGMDEQKTKEEFLAKFHENLSDEEYDKYREEGKKLTLEEACQLVVSS